MPQRGRSAEIGNPPYPWLCLGRRLLDFLRRLLDFLDHYGRSFCRDTRDCPQDENLCRGIECRALPREFLGTLVGCMAAALVGKVRPERLRLFLLWGFCLTHLRRPLLTL